MDDVSAASTTSRGRRLRADAVRNRTAILGAARDVFETQGVLASLDGIAVRAGVGNATLYRNFPTRYDLLAAVMESSLATAVADAQDLARTRQPGEALREWVVQLAWRLRIWHDLPQCIATAQPGGESSMDPVRWSLEHQTGLLLAAAKTSGEAVDSTTAGELFELVTALSWAVDRFGDDEQSARRRVQLGTAGIFTAGNPRHATRNPPAGRVAAEPAAEQRSTFTRFDVASGSR